jgi:hypothetical protein
MKDEVNPVDCAQFENIVHEIERPGTEGFALRESALTHAESCSSCARLMTEAESLDAGLRAIMAGAATQKAPPGVEAALMVELRRKRAAYLRSRAQRQIAALSTAAAALLAVGLSMHHWAEGRGNAPPRIAGVANVPASSPAVRAVAPAAGTTSQALAEGIDADDYEYATSFVPLPYADDLSALDDGAVVRVEMPRAALASFGLPVAAMESDGTVRADLIVSADGTPQAIRLVPQDSASRQ